MKSTGYVMDGVYYTKDSIGKQGPVLPAAASSSITYKVYSHDKQRMEHQRDLIQPYVSGQPNPLFIEQYPEESKQRGFI